MPRPHILISIETHLDIHDRSFGKAFMEALCNTDKRLVPELVSTSENFKDAFVDLDNFLDKWWAMPAEMRVDGRLTSEFFWGPHWKRKSALASRGVVDHGGVDNRNDRMPSYLWFESRWAADVDFARLFEAWVDLAKPDIGMLHLFTKPDLEWPGEDAGRAFTVGAFGGPAIPGTPNIGWAMAYGEGYAADVDVGRVRSAGFPVDERDGIIVVRVTEKLSDVTDNFAYFSRRRAELKSLFRPGFFRIQKEPAIID